MDSDLNLSIIAAVSENGVIGSNGGLPWNLQRDLQAFAQKTRGHLVIAGRKTHESIIKRLGHPLSGRTTIVMTRQDGYVVQDCLVANSWEKVLSIARTRDDEVFVIGGAQIYRLALPYTKTIYLTRVLATFKEGDTFFPEIKTDEWKMVSRERHSADEKNSHPFYFLTLKRQVEEPKQFVNLEYARFKDQCAVMKRIQQEGVCPFCPENRVSGEISEPLKRGNYWTLVPNRWPYEFTTLHAMLILERHIRFFDELRPAEVAELVELLGWARKDYGLSAYSLGVRCGNPCLTGATVDHLHIHLVVADPETEKPGYERIRFAMGPKPTRTS